MKLAALYSRVSTSDNQEPETQMRLLRQEAQRLGYEVYKEYTDRVSALDIKHRIAWRDLMADAKKRKFQVVMVYRLDRAFRSLIHMQLTFNQWESWGIGFKSYSDPVDTTTASGRLHLNILGAFAEFERCLIAERVTAGMQRARAEGKKLGRPLVTQRNGFLPRFKLVLERYNEGELSLRSSAKELGVGAATFSRLSRAYQKGDKNFAADFSMEQGRQN